MAVHAEGKFTTMDVFRGGWPAVRRSILIVNIVGLAIVVQAVALSLAEKRGLWGNWYAFPVGIFLILYMWFFVFYRARRQIKQSPNLQAPIQYDFDEGGYRMTASHSNSDIKWSAIAKWKEGKHGFIIYANVNFGSIVPKRFFQNAADVEAVRGLLKAHAKRK
jgi:YcxB-like protein